MDLEEEIRTELERLEQIFNEESQLECGNTQGRAKPNRLSYSAFEYAEAEGEKEELEDKFKQLVSRTEDWNAQIEYISRLNAELQTQNTLLLAENNLLRERDRTPITGVGNFVSTSNGETESNNCTSMEPAPTYECYGSISQGSIALELLLAETRAKLLRMEAAYQDAVLVKDTALLELEGERVQRVHAERERDAFSAAYEASLQHFDKWSRASSSNSSRPKS